MTDKEVVWQSAKITHKGNVRDYNEDACLILEKPPLWVVADGMGGHEAGDIASKMIMDQLQYISESDQLNDLVDSVDDILTNVNTNLRALGREKYNNRTIGSTVIAMVACNDYIAYLWAGDSRLYRIRDNKIQSLSTDHSEVQNLIDQGMLKPEDAESHPAANVITRAIGASDGLYLSVGIEKALHNDIYVLCSDGLYRDIVESEILALALKYAGETFCEQLMLLALSREAKDNITIIFAKSDIREL